MFEEKITFDRFIRIAATIAVITGIILLVNRLSSVLLPFFIAWLVAYLIHPIVKFFHRHMRIRSKIPAIILTLVLMFAAIFLAIMFFIPPIIEESVKAKDLLADFIRHSPEAQSVPAIIGDFIREHLSQGDIGRFIKSGDLKSMLEAIVPQLWTFMAKSLDVIFGIVASFIILLYLFFILLDYETLANGWIKLIPVKYRDFARQLSADLEEGMSKYFRGQSLVAFCVGVLCAIGFFITGGTQPHPLHANARIHTHDTPRRPQRRRDRRQLLDYHGHRSSGGMRGTNHRRLSAGAENHGQGHRHEPGHHTAVALGMGIAHGDKRHDHSPAADHHPAVILRKVHPAAQGRQGRQKS